jgi:hypothetical protein
MARRVLIVTDYQAEYVLVPGKNKATQRAVRITVFGDSFPQRAIEPEILAGETPARNVSIAPGQKSIRGLFDQEPAEGTPIRVRYGDSQEGVLREPFVRKNVRTLPEEC